MRYAREKKRREYRKAARTHKRGLNLWKLFDKLYPEYDRRPRWGTWDWYPWWHQVDNIRDEWIESLTGEVCPHHHGMGHAPAHYRRTLNRLRRSREKQALRKVQMTGDWDDFYIPRPRKDADWNWW